MLRTNVTTGAHASTIGDLVLPTSALANWTAALNGLADSAAALTKVKDEVSGLAFLGAECESFLLATSSPPFSSSPSDSAKRNMMTLKAGGEINIGPIKLAGISITYRDEQTVSVINPTWPDYQPTAQISFTPTVKRGNVWQPSLMVQSCTAEAAVFAIAKACALLTENSTSMLQMIRSQIARSQNSSPFDRTDEARLNALLSGPTQENIKRWALTAPQYGLRTISTAARVQGNTLGILLSNAILESLAPSISDAYKYGKSAFDATGV